MMPLFTYKAFDDEMATPLKFLQIIIGLFWMLSEMIFRL